MAVNTASRDDLLEFIAFFEVQIQIRHQCTANKWESSDRGSRTAHVRQQYVGKSRKVVVSTILQFATREQQTETSVRTQLTKASRILPFTIHFDYLVLTLLNLKFIHV